MLASFCLDVVPLLILGQNVPSEDLTEWTLRMYIIVKVMYV